MIKSIEPDLSSVEILQLLVETSYTFETEDTIILNAVDIGAAVWSLVGME